MNVIFPCNQALDCRVKTKGNRRCFNNNVELRKYPHGFTLIELLVVISIIALLISILLPAMTQAKRVSRQAICANNTKQMALATHVYAADYDGVVPAPNQMFPYSTYRVLANNIKVGYVLLVPYLGGSSETQVSGVGSGWQTSMCPENPRETVLGWYTIGSIGIQDTDYLMYSGALANTAYMPGSSTLLHEMSSDVVMYTDLVLDAGFGYLLGPPAWSTHDYGYSMPWRGVSCSRVDGSAAWVAASFGNEDFFSMWSGAVQWSYRVPRFVGAP